MLVDTSAAIALVMADHEQHEATLDAIGARVLGLAGHAAFETFSVLTRLPAPARRTPAAVAQVVASNFPASRFLSARAADRLLHRLPDIGIAGSAVYDALVGATAIEHRLPLATRDQRAVETYRALGGELELLALP